MANIRWPPWARIRADETLARRPDVARTEFDDGAVQQRRIRTQGVYTRQVTVELGARMAEFDAWATEHAHRYVLLRSLWDDVWRQVRVVGGAGGITYRQVGSSRSGPLWTAECALEGPAVAYPGISIWNAGLALGDASHVYVRVLDQPWYAESPSSGYTDQIASLPNAALAADGLSGGLSAAWMASGTAAYLVAAEIHRIRATQAVSAKLLTATAWPVPPGEMAGHSAGPDMRPGVLAGIAAAWRYGDRTLVVRGWDDDVSASGEPYDIAPSNPAEVQAMLNALIAGSAPRTGDFALVWAGAGSVVDLGTLTTLDIGAAPEIA